MTTSELAFRIRNAATTPQPRLTRDGYTCRGGSPTHLEAQIVGETVWRRVYSLCFGTGTTWIVKRKGANIIVPGDVIQRAGLPDAA